MQQVLARPEPTHDTAGVPTTEHIGMADVKPADMVFELLNRRA